MIADLLACRQVADWPSAAAIYRPGSVRLAPVTSIILKQIVSEITEIVTGADKRYGARCDRSRGNTTYTYD